MHLAVLLLLLRLLVLFRLLLFQVHLDLDTAADSWRLCRRDARANPLIRSRLALVRLRRCDAEKAAGVRLLRGETSCCKQEGEPLGQDLVHKHAARV